MNPYIPQKLAGVQILPPISPPRPRGEHFEEINAASPPDDPPGLQF